MVFEHIAAFFVDKFLGNYIEDFDSHQLKIHLWEGDIILENVHLKTNALNNLNVPIEIQTGFLEKLRLHIPWKHLYSHPTKVEIDGLYIVISPKTDVNYDPKRREQEEYESKMKEVRKVEEFRRERERYELNQQALHHKDTFFERLQFHILRNLEISIKNIHIVYEDKTTKSYPFQIGITLASATLQTTNDEWENVEVKEDAKVIYKLGQIDKLSIYWNSNVPSRLELTNEDMISDLKSDRHLSYPTWNYILQPLNARAKLKIAKAAQEQDFQQPVLEAKIELDEIYLNINRSQYSDLLDLLEFQDYLNMKSKYIRYHSILSDDQGEKLSRRRWKFAYSAIINEYVRPRLAAFQWETIKTNLERYREYRQLYLKVLLRQTNKQENQRSQDLEKLIDVFNLIYLRRTADIEYKKKKIEEKDMSWWDKMKDWWNSKATDDEEFRTSETLTLEEKQEFYKAIGYRDDQPGKQVAYPDEYIDTNLSLGLNLLQINVWFNTTNASKMKWISRASIFNTELHYQHRPARDDFALIVDLDSFEMIGNDGPLEDQNTLNLTGPILIQSFEQNASKQTKLLHIEFETNPLNSQVDYRLVAQSTPLQITYHAVTVNQLIECFLPDRHHDLEGIKQAAYSLYTDIKHQTQFLLSENLKKIKDLDINVDLKSIYFILPERGSDTESSSAMCVDLGRLTFRGGQKNIEGSSDDGYVPIKIQLTSLQLLYLNQNERWQEHRLKKDSPAHFIKPINFTLDVFKLIQIDQNDLPIWKARGYFNDIETRLSDSRMIGGIQLIQSIPLPQSSTSSKTKTKEKRSRSKETKSTKQTYQTIEQMTPVKKILHEQETESEKSPGSNEQRVQLEGDLQIPKIEILFQRDLSNENEDFLRLSISTINASSKVKTYDIEFKCSIDDLNIRHEQFETTDGNRLNLFSRSNRSKKFLTINGLLTSPSNPSFSQAPYHSVENRISFDLSKILLNLQLEALISIFEYEKTLMKKIETQPSAPPAPSPPTASSPSSDSSSFQIDFHLEEISLLIGNHLKQILYVQLKEFAGYFAQTHLKIAARLALNDFRVIDAQSDALYPLIIGKTNPSNDLIQFELALFHSTKKLPKILQEKDSFLKGQIEKLNIVFLYKHLDLLLSLINAFQTKKSEPPPPPPVQSDEPGFLASLLQKYQEQSLQFHLNLILHAPQILVPVNSYSTEGLLIDLGKLSMQTENQDDVEDHRIRFENVSINRISLHQGQFVVHRQFLQCSPFVTLIQRYLNPKHEENANAIVIKTQWDTIEMKLGKSDNAFIKQILDGNFKEKFFPKLPQVTNDVAPSPSPPPSSPSKQPIPTREKPISFQIRWTFQMKEISLILYLDEPNLQTPADETSKFLALTIDKIEANFRHTSRSHYQGALKIHQFYADDVSKTKSDNSLSRLMNKGFNIDTNAPFLNASFEMIKATCSAEVQLESLNILISANMINATKEFFTYELPKKRGRKPREILAVTNDLPIALPQPAKSISKYRSTNEVEEEKPSPTPQRSNVSSTMETKIDVVLKPSRFILIEDPKNENSNCLSLNIELKMNLVQSADQTKISASIGDLSFYGANFEQLKNSKWKYSILQPSNIDVMMMMNSNEQKIDVHLGNLSINIDPALIRTFVTLSKSLTETPKVNPNEEKEKINSKHIFNPRPFKDSTFWFIEDWEEKQEVLEERDILEMTTGSPSQRKNDIDERNKEKSDEQKETRAQQLIVNLKIIEVKMELGEGSSTRPVLAACLSNIYADIENWSTDLTISSYVEIELALFNDHLLAWEPLIEPIIDQYGNVQSPWAITCETLLGEQDENNDQNRFLLNDDGKEETKADENTEGKESGLNLSSNKAILIRAEHLLNVTFTKTTLDLFQRLAKMFNDAYAGGFASDADDEQSILSIHNQTGYEISIDNISGIEFSKDYQGKTDSLTLKVNESINMTVPNERLSATHLPAIAEQVAKRKQQFQVQINERKVTVDINQTWRRVYELSDSQNPQWPVQLLVDSHIYKERRRVILSSIIRVSNRTESPLVVLDADAVEQHRFHSVATIKPNDEYYLPIELLYSRITPRLYFTIQQDETNVDGGTLPDFISFDWSNEESSDRILKLNNGKQMHCVVFKQDVESYSENTDEPNRKSFNILVKLALHVMNLLPIPIQCAIDNIEHVELEPSQLYHSTAGHKKSILRFKIPSYNNATWISEDIDLNTKGHGIHNEHVVEFNDVITKESLRMILRVDTYRGSFRASFYAPFWVVNATDLKFQMKIENEKTFVDAIEAPYFICPKKFRSDSHKQKGHIRLFSIEEDETVSQWSEGFSLDVIKSTGITSCKVINDRTYMVCIDIVTSSFGMSKIITLTPSTAIINNSSFDLEVAENISETEGGNWKTVKANQIIPYWPRQIKEGVMYVRYAGNGLSSSCFSIKDKHRTLLRMDDEDRPALHVEVTVTDFDGYKINFGDYKIGDAPLLIVNSLINQPITFCQKEDIRSQMLPPQYYVYYTWMDPFKPQELILSCDNNSMTIPLNPACGVVDKNAEEQIYYATFHDGPQTVLLVSSETSIIEVVSDMPSMNETMKNYIQLSFRSIGISIINDISRDDLFYITINPSKEIWTEKRRFNSRPLSQKINQHLDDQHKKYLKDREENNQRNYDIDKHRHIIFDENNAEIRDDEGHQVRVQRESLDGLWLGFAWSTNNQAIHLRINHIQIDNQLQITLFPTILHPIVSKANATDIPGKPFIELSVFKSQSSRSNTIHIKYFKLLVQEFFASVDQGLIMAIMNFVKAEKNPAAPTVDMSSDLKRIEKPLETLVKGDTDNSSPETKIYFDNLHLSPLKIHVSFSMHGAKANEQLLAEYPLVDFLLQILNVAEVQDVILKLNYYERKNDRYSIDRLTQEIAQHYQNQFLRQLHVVVLGLDVLGNPFGVLRGVAEGVESFFYEPYQGAMEGPIEFIEGIATGTKYFVGSVVGGAAGALSKVTATASKGLATLTLDHQYQNVRIQRKELQAQTTPEIVSSGKNTLKDFIQGVKGVVKKPIKGAKERGTTGFVKGLGKGFLGLVGRPASGVADLTSTSLKLIKRVATNEDIVHRIRPPRHVGRDGIVRPSIAHETFGNFFFHQLIEDKSNPTEGYIGHIESSSKPSSYFFATTKRIMFFTESESTPNSYQVDWEHHYKEIKGSPLVKFDPNFIEITQKETNALGMTKKDVLHIRVVPYDNIGEARYIVDKINETMTILEV